MTDAQQPVYQVTWSAAHEAERQAQLLAAYKHLWRAHAAAPVEMRKHTDAVLCYLADAMAKPTMKAASAWYYAWSRRRAKGVQP